MRAQAIPAILFAGLAVALALPFLRPVADPIEPAWLPASPPLDPAAVFEGIRRKVAPHGDLETPGSWDGYGWCDLTDAWRRHDPDRVIRGSGWAARLEVSDDLGWEKTNLHVPVPSYVVGQQVYLVNPEEFASGGQEREGLARILVFEVPPVAPRP